MIHNRILLWCGSKDVAGLYSLIKEEEIAPGSCSLDLEENISCYNSQDSKLHQFIQFNPLLLKYFGG